ncbi:MAG: RAMP superfamily CRISPR-associated protein [Acidobacteriota bacterium]
MHRRALNHFCLRLEIRPRGPLLVQGSDQAPDPSRPDLAFVRTRHWELGETIFLPGTGLKGAVRSHAEATLRGLDVPVCDPLRSSACSANTTGASPAVYAAMCPACRTFGSLDLAGRLDFTDAMPWPPEADSEARRAAAVVANATERRAHVGIDRRTGGPRSGALYETEE